jgi:hypothetical protein
MIAGPEVEKQSIVTLAEKLLTAGAWVEVVLKRTVEADENTGQELRRSIAFCDVVGFSP